MPSTYWAELQFQADYAASSPDLLLSPETTYLLDLHKRLTHIERNFRPLQAIPDPTPPPLSDETSTFHLEDLAEAAALLLYLLNDTESSTADLRTSWPVSNLKRALEGYGQAK